MTRLLPLLVLLLAACARPMTEAETHLAHTLFGDEIDTSRVRVSRGLGLAPVGRSAITEVRLVTGTDQACVRVPQPRDAAQPLAFAVRDRIHLTSDIYAGDAALGWPDAVRFPNALIFAHELTHVWQWQNRERTGYSAARAISESLALADPYFAPPGETDFFAYGFEQQAAFVEDFICFTAANPDHPRRQELRAILAPVIDVEAVEAALAP